MEIIEKYISEVKKILGKDFIRAVVYGSFARKEYGAESDIDIAIFTNQKPEQFYLLVEKIAEVTFEYNVKYDVFLSPIFQTRQIFTREYPMFRITRIYKRKELHLDSGGNEYEKNSERWNCIL